MIVLVTGASSGFGAAIARRFVREGHRVIAAARRTDRLDSLAKELGPQLIPLELDVTSKASIDAMLVALPPDLRQIDVLVNNAGLALGLEPAQEAHLSDWETMIATNCQGLVWMTRALLPQMVARGSGLVINIGSVAGSYPYPGGNVRATNLAPGMSGGTEFSNVRFKGNNDAAAKVYSGTQPLTADDVAEAAYWVATLPAHININQIEMMPTCQGFSAFTVKRNG